MDIQTKLQRLSALGLKLDIEKTKPFTSVALTPAGENIENKLYKLEDAIKKLLDREGKFGAFDNFYGATPSLPDILELIDIENPIAWIAKNRVDRYRKCFDVAHFYANGGAWTYIIGDIIRPLDDDLPLIIDLVPRVIDAHPNTLQAEEFPSSCLPTAKKIIESLQRELARLSLELPKDLAPITESADPKVISEWASAAKGQMTSDFKKLLEAPVAADSTAAMRTIKIAIAVIVTAYELYGKIKPIIDAIVYVLEKQAEEQRKQIEARKREYEREFGPMPSEIPHASDHIDAYEHNKDILSRTV